MVPETVTFLKNCSRALCKLIILHEKFLGYAESNLGLLKQILLNERSSSEQASLGSLNNYINLYMKVKSKNFVLKLNYLLDVKNCDSKTFLI